MSWLDNFSEFRFCASVNAGRNGENNVVEISLIDTLNPVVPDTEQVRAMAGRFASRFIRVNDKGQLIFSPNPKKMEDGYTIEMERFEQVATPPGTPPGRASTPVYNLILKVCKTKNSNADLSRRIRELERENALLKKEVKELIDLVEKIEEIKESFRLPFDAIKDLMISFDFNANVLVVNKASTNWFGMTPQDIVRKKYKTILEQDIPAAIRNVYETKKNLTVQEQIGGKFLQITYMPMTNNKTGETEVVMLAQDITKQKTAEQQSVARGKNEAVAVMGGTMRHILNSSLHAILGFAQLSLSSYDWPRETMFKYLKLIERTALRMKREISTIAEQKEYKTSTYIDIPEAGKSHEILRVEMNRKSD